MSSALSRVMDQAADAAATAGQVPANVNTYSAPAVAAARPSLDAMADSSGITVDAYLTIKDTGFRIGDAKSKLFTEMEGTIDLSQVAPIVSIRATSNGATSFVKSYDGVMTSTGQNFANAVQQAQATADKVDGPYQTVEVPLRLTKAAGGLDVGKVVGITPSITGAKFWTTFYKQLREAGLQRATVQVRVKHLYQNNTKGNEWGVPEFELLGEVGA